MGVSYEASLMGYFLWLGCICDDYTISMNGFTLPPCLCLRFSLLLSLLLSVTQIENAALAFVSLQNVRIKQPTS